MVWICILCNGKELAVKNILFLVNANEEILGEKIYLISKIKPILLSKLENKYDNID